MFFKKKKTSKSHPLQSSPMESFEVVYKKEAEIHRRWQEIEDTALRLQRKYESDPSALRFIEHLRVVEKIFTEGEVRGWTNEQIREKLIQNNIDNLTNAQALSENAAQLLHEDFKKVCASIQKVSEVARRLLKKYVDHPEYHAFIYYLRDIYSAFLESGQPQTSARAFKERLISIRMELFVADGDTEMSKLEMIYQEFREAVY